MIIGIGNIAQVHLKCLLHLGIDIVALCDSKIELCLTAKEDYTLNCQVYDNYQEMLNKEQADIVHICTPHYLHSEMIEECMKKGLHVFAEKPLAISEYQMQELGRNIKSFKQKLGVCFQNRFSPAVCYAKTYLEDKTIDGITASLSWDRGWDYYYGSEWKGKKALEGGSVLINQAIHTIDLIRYLKGMPSSIVCHTSTDTLGKLIETEESAFILFDFEDGCRAILNASNSSTAYFDVVIQIHTSDNHCVLIVGENIFIDGEPIPVEQSDYYFGKKAWGTNHLTCIKEFYATVCAGEEFALDFSEAEKTMRILFKCYESCGEKLVL